MVLGLVDTGATHSVMSTSILEDMRGTGTFHNVLGRSVNLRDASGRDLPVVGSVTISIGDTERLKVQVVTDLDPQVIVGADAIEAIDLQKGSVRVCGRDFGLTFAEGGALSSVTDVRLPREGALASVLSRYGAAFYETNRKLGNCTTLPPMRIRTEGPPIATRPYRAPLHKRQVISDEIDEMLAQGVIRPSESPWASPVTLAPKKDGTLRFCVDYRRLNAVTKKDKYPIPNIQDIFDSLGQNECFTTLDLKSGYWQIPLAECDREKTAFVCHRGHFEANFVFFGLTNAPSYFQRAMDRILSPLIGTCVFVYIDDIIVYSTSKEQHILDVEKVLQLLIANGLKLKASKCDFCEPQVELLGYIISREGISPNPEKISAIKDIPVPVNVKEVRSFLGSAGYYRQCIPGYATIAEPMVQLTRKGEPFVWTVARSEAFVSLKEALVSNNVMARPNLSRPYKLYTDACDYAIGAILVQEADDGMERPVHYLSHQLDATQRKWATIEKEAYAVVYALSKLRPYLLAADFVVYTDHKPLLSLFTKEMNNTKIQRWSVLIAEFGAKIMYHPGKLNIHADMLSRIRAPVGEVVTLTSYDVPDDLDGICEEFDPLRDDAIDRKDLCIAQRKEFPDEWEDAKGDEEDSLLIGGLIYSERPPYPGAPECSRLLLPEAWRERIVRTRHEEMGHLAYTRTLKHVQVSYVWPGMRRDVRRFCRECVTCLAFARRRVRVPPVEMPVPRQPMELVGLDFIGPFVASPKGNRYVLTVIDYCTGWAEAYPVPDQTAGTLISVFSNEFMSRHGHPRKVMPDHCHVLPSLDVHAET